MKTKTRLRHRPPIHLTLRHSTSKRLNVKHADHLPFLSASLFRSKHHSSWYLLHLLQRQVPFDPDYLLENAGNVPPEADGKGEIVGPSDIEPNGVFGPNPEVCVNAIDGSYIQSFKSDRGLFQVSAGLELDSTVSESSSTSLMFAMTKIDTLSTWIGTTVYTVGRECRDCSLE